jgi:hypothetical protein
MESRVSLTYTSTEFCISHSTKNSVKDTSHSSSFLTFKNGSALSSARLGSYSLQLVFIAWMIGRSSISCSK